MYKKHISDKFPMSFSGDNTLIIPNGGDWKTILTNQIKELDASGKTVVITDAYLFQNDTSIATYKEDLLDILKQLNAKKIIFSTHSDFGPREIRNHVKNGLESTGITVEWKKAPIHDRFWVCIESKKAFDFLSPNGVHKGVSRSTFLTVDEVEQLKEVLINQGVIEDEETKEEGIES